jgi:hypothetical protein
MRKKIEEYLDLRKLFYLKNSKGKEIKKKSLE